MLHDIAVLAAIAVASYLVVTFHSAVIAKIKAQAAQIETATWLSDPRKSLHAVAENVKDDAEKVGSILDGYVAVADSTLATGVKYVKADASKVEAKL